MWKCICTYIYRIEYQKILKPLDDTTHQPSKLRRRNWLEINNEVKERYDNGNIRFKTSIIRSNLRHYSDAYILVKGTITVPNTAACASVNDTNKTVMFKSFALFTDFIIEINNTQADDPKINWCSNVYV